MNGETRNLVKRSSRESDLKEMFKVREMSSISTLEVAWENESLWSGDSFDERSFCREVAETNKLELLKWIREEKKCEWDQDTINAATRGVRGNLEMVKYCVAHKCPINEFACANAAENGQLECLKYLREEAKAPWESHTAAWAAQNGHLHILEYLVERKYDQYSEFACENAAKYGHLDCLKYLRETAVELFGRARRSQEKPPGMFTIPPRQQLSSPRRLVLRRRRNTKRSRFRRFRRRRL